MSTEPQPALPPRTSHWPFAVAFYIMALLWGVRQVYYWQPSMLDVLVLFGLPAILGWWAISDSITRGHPIPMASRAWFILLAGIVVPGYLIWSRGWRGAGWLVLHAIAWYALCLMTMFVGRMIAFGVGFGQ